LSYTSFGLTLIGGLTTATLLTLLVVPIFYTLFDDLGATAMSLLKALRSKGAGETGVGIRTPDSPSPSQ
jgi:HAE1 family hydrophobic/amphiphilic exporter-1